MWGFLYRFYVLLFTTLVIDYMLVQEFLEIIVAETTIYTAAEDLLAEKWGFFPFFISLPFKIVGKTNKVSVLAKVCKYIWDLA